MEAAFHPEMTSILLIEVDHSLRAEFRTALAHRGHHLIEAADGDSGLAQFNANNPDLVLTEVSLPRKGGLEVIAQVLADRPHTKVFAFAEPQADRGINILEIATILGATRTFEKPLDVQEIVQAVSDELGTNSSFGQ